MNRLSKIVVISALTCVRLACAEDDPFKILFVSTNGFNPVSATLSGSTLYVPGVPSSSGGILFKISTDRDSAPLKTFQRRSSDDSYPDGSYPYGAVLVAGTKIYGTTLHGGRYRSGVAYRVNTDGTGFILLHEFDNTNGSSPRGPLVLSGTTLFGVTSDGGSNDVSGRGTVFSISTDGSGFRVLKGFCGVNCTGLPARPEGGLVLSGSTLYGTTTYDYANTADPQCGSIFKINTDGGGFTVIKHLSSADGRQPQTPLIASGTTLYGAAPGGGAANKGTIFKLNTDGTGFNVLKDFAGLPGDGEGPSTLILSGTQLFGATGRGGSADFGTIFVLNVDGSDFAILREFPDSPQRGHYPQVSALSGLTLFGTTYSWNSSNYGEVFSLTLSPPTITTAPQSQTAETGSNVGFFARAAGFPQPTYEWRFNEGIPLDWGSNHDFHLTNVQPSHTGAYTLIASNSFGAVTSAPALLNVIPPLERRSVPGVLVTAESGSSLSVDCTDAFGDAAQWLLVDTVIMASTSQWCFDLSAPLPPQRFYRAWQSGQPIALPSLKLPGMVPALTLTGTVDSQVRVDGINQFGPTDVWFTLDTVRLTNTSQLYFDVTAPGQPGRLYRLVPVP